MTRQPPSQRLRRSAPHPARAACSGARRGPRRDPTGGHRHHRPGGKWGNPFKIGRDGDRAAVIAKHEAWLRNRHDLRRTIAELRGKDLVCFCALAACCGELLLRLANGSREEMVAW